MLTYEKINVYSSKEMFLLLEKDIRIFEIFKKNNDLNKNKFLNLLVLGYANEFEEENNVKCLQIEQFLNTEFYNTDNHQLAENIVQTLQISKSNKKNKSGVKLLSIKPVKESKLVFQDIINHKDNISGYLVSMFNSYLELPIFERERIIFKENYNKIRESINSHREIIFYTIWNKDEIHEVKPIEIVISEDERHNYLICLENNTKLDQVDIKSYRLNRMERILIKNNNNQLKLTEDLSKKIDIMKINGPQYAINSNNEISVKLSNKGLKTYRRVYLGRPLPYKIEKIGDGAIYYFNCSEFQIYKYFLGFSFDEVEILGPENLREKFKNFYEQNFLSYKKS